MPNAGRLLPTYLRGAVLQGEHEIVMALYGPMRTVLDVAGATVTVQQQTEYPEQLAADRVVTSSPPRSVALVLRAPGWATEVDVAVEAADGGDADVPGFEVTREADRVVLRGVWSRHRVRLRFVAAPTVESDPRGHGFVRLEPRMLGLPIPNRTSVTRDHAVAGLVDVAVVPVIDEHEDLALTLDPQTVHVVPGGVEAAFRTRTIRRPRCAVG
ncbi:MAG: hypothetical protein WCA29_11105 [Jiangellales bacterium]